jgi:hypothetical protein
VERYDIAAMDTRTCYACRFGLDDSDNFCRRCGVAADRAPLPVVRESAVPAVWHAQVSPVVKGAAVMAAGTIGQFVFRRVVSNVLGGGTRRKGRAIKIGGGERDDMVDEAQIITETVMLRRVRVRRQA